MKVLLFTDSLFVSTGYANQARQISQVLKKQGHTVLVQGIGYNGIPIEWEGIRMFAGPFGASPDHTTLALIDQYDIQVVITLKDPYHFDVGTMRQIPFWVAMIPVDTLQLPSVTDAILKEAAMVLSISKHGHQALEAAGYDPIFTPHSVNMEFYTLPTQEAVDRARVGFNFPEGLKVFLFVGANVTYPPRKSIEQLLIAWSRFALKHDDVLLYMHTTTADTYSHSTYPIIAMAQMLNIPEDTLRLTPDYQAYTGVKEDVLRMLYHAANAFVLPSGGEGFGIPLLEAQACGLPAIATDFTAQKELLVCGVDIPAPTIDEVFNANGEFILGMQGGYYFRPSAAAIYNALEAMYKLIDGPDPLRVKQASLDELAKTYSLRAVHGYWKTAMEAIMHRLEGRLDA